MTANITANNVAVFLNKGLPLLGIARNAAPPGFGITLRAATGRTNDLESTTDFKTWTILTNLVASPQGTALYLDPSQIPGEVARFYRSRQRP